MSGTLGIPVLIGPNDTWSVMWSEYCLLPILKAGSMMECVVMKKPIPKGTFWV